MKHALVTGGAGFIGSHLCEALLARDYRVTALDDESTGTGENLAGVRDHFHFSFVSGSAMNKTLVRSLLSDVEEVYHLAAAVGADLITAAPIHTIETNIYPTELMLSELRRRAKQGHVVKLFLASSSDVYGKNPKSIWSEDDELVFGPTTSPRWCYGASRALAEFLAIAYWREHRLPVVIGRFFNIVGPRQSGAYGNVLPRFVEAAVTGQNLIVHGDGEQLRCFAHVTDVANWIIALMDAPAAVSGVFNIGGDEPVSIVELAERVIRAARPGLSIEFQSFSEALGPEFEAVPSRVPDLARIRGVIPFQPTMDLDAIIREVVAIAKAKHRRQ